MERYLMTRILTLCLISILVLNSACVTHVVSPFAPSPDADGVMYVATDRPIAVAVQGEDRAFHQDVGGYYLVHRSELNVFLKVLRRYKEMKTSPPDKVLELLDAPLP